MNTLQLFETLASSTWHTIFYSHLNRVQLGEDAITSYILYTLACSNINFALFEDKRPEEHKVGCDFELFIGEDTIGWYRYAIQAKKIQVSTGRYANLKHFVKGTPCVFRPNMNTHSDST